MQKTIASLNLSVYHSRDENEQEKKVTTKEQFMTFSHNDFSSRLSAFTKCSRRQK